MKIKATKTGSTYAVINKRAARALAGTYPLPEEGGLVTVAICPSDRSTLKLANDKGEWLLETFDKTVAEWPRLFGVTIETDKGAKMKIKNYMVKLDIIAGEYEKTARHIVQAKTKAGAIKQAYLGESHCDTAKLDRDTGYWVDGHGDFAYRAVEVKEISTDALLILRRYF